MIKIINGNCGHDYYLQQNNRIKAVAKNSQYESCEFGPVGYLDKLLAQKGTEYLGKLTKAGQRLLNLNQARKGYNVFKYDYLQKESPIDFYNEVHARASFIHSINLYKIKRGRLDVYGASLKSLHEAVSAAKELNYIK